MTILPKIIGYWAVERAPWQPDPRRLVDTSWDPAERAAVAVYLRQGREASYCMGYSWCRFRCGIANEQMGAAELTDGVWLWPEGLVHYVEVHQVGLPEAFVRDALAGQPTGAPVNQWRMYDEREWLRWARAHGACSEALPPWIDDDALFEQTLACLDD